MRKGLAWLLFGGGFLSSAAAFGLSTQLDSLPSLMSREDHRVALVRIQSGTRQALGGCRALEEAHARKACKARVRAEDRVRRAELAATYYGTIAAARQVEAARARAAFDVARSGCEDRSGKDRRTCLAAARQARDHAAADAPAGAT